MAKSAVNQQELHHHDWRYGPNSGGRWQIDVGETRNVFGAKLSWNAKCIHKALNTKCILNKNHKIINHKIKKHVFHSFIFTSKGWLGEALFEKITISSHSSQRKKNDKTVQIVGSDLSMIVDNECDLDIWFSDYQLNNTTI